MYEADSISMPLYLEEVKTKKGDGSATAKYSQYVV